MSCSIMGHHYSLLLDQIVTIYLFAYSLLLTMSIMNIIEANSNYMGIFTFHYYEKIINSLLLE